MTAQSSVQNNDLNLQNKSTENMVPENLAAATMQSQCTRNNGTIEIVATAIEELMRAREAVTSVPSVAVGQRQLYSWIPDSFILFLRESGTQGAQGTLTPERPEEVIR